MEYRRLLFNNTGFSNNINLPDLGEPYQSINIQLKEQQLAKEVLKAIRTNFSIIHDPIINQYLNNFVIKLTAHTLTKQQIKFFIIKENSINAFALPGSYIGIHTGLITSSENEHEFASVLAHEIAHLQQYHIARLDEYSSNLRIPTIAAIIAATILAAYNPALGQGALFGAIGGSQQSMINFMRSKEREADRIGINILYESNHDPYAFVSFLQKINNDANSKYIKIQKYLQTHPLTYERIADAEQRAAELNYKQYIHDDEFYIIKQHLKNQDVVNNNEYIEELEGKLKSEYYTKKFAIEYGLALALINNNQHQKSQNLVLKLHKQFPGISAISILYYRYLFASLQDDLAFSKIKHHLELYPDDISALLLFCSESIDRKYVVDAKDALLRYINKIDDSNPEVYFFLSKSYHKINKKIDAKLSYIKYLILIENYKLAETQLRDLKNIKNLQPSDKYKILGLSDTLKKSKDTS